MPFWGRKFFRAEKKNYFFFLKKKTFKKNHVVNVFFFKLIGRNKKNFEKKFGREISTVKKTVREKS